MTTDVPAPFQGHVMLVGDFNCQIPKELAEWHATQGTASPTMLNSPKANDYILFEDARLRLSRPPETRLYQQDHDVPSDHVPVDANFETQPAYGPTLKEAQSETAQKFILQRYHIPQDADADDKKFSRGVDEIRLAALRGSEAGGTYFVSVLGMLYCCKNRWRKQRDIFDARQRQEYSLSSLKLTNGSLFYINDKIASKIASEIPKWLPALLGPDEPT